MELFCNILSVIMQFLFVWLIGGCIAVLVDYAETIQEGMAKIGIAVFHVMKKIGVVILHRLKLNGMETSMVQIPDYRLAPLITKLEPYFTVLVLLSANEDSNMQTIVCRQNGCSIDIDIIEIIYRKFIRDVLNLNSEVPLYVYVDIDEEYLYLYAATSEDGRKKIEQERNNRRSRELSVEEDILL